MHSSSCTGMEINSAIKVSEYHPLWPKEFELVRDEIQAQCGNSIGPIHHVGSTSVPGLDAKPIIDILIAVNKLEEALKLVPALEAIGFSFKPDDELPDRLYFSRTFDGLRHHQLSIAEPASICYINTLAFRNALRRDSSLAREYTKLKRNLATTVGSNRFDYLNGKSDFILRALRKAGCEVENYYPEQYGAGRN